MRAVSRTPSGSTIAAWPPARRRARSGHKGEHDGVAMAQKSGLYYAAIAGTAGTKPVERELFKGVCYCCKTAMATGPKGEIFAAWRHVFAGNFRDMGFTVSRDGGKSFSPLVRVSEDGWSINGCPDDGPAMAVDAAGTVHLVWPTVIGGAEGAILYATSRDGRSFSKPVRVPTLGSPKPSHPQVIVDGKPAASPWHGMKWLAGGSPPFAGSRSILHVPSRSVRSSVLPAEGASTYPVLAATNNGSSPSGSPVAIDRSSGCGPCARSGAIEFQAAGSRTRSIGRRGGGAPRRRRGRRRREGARESTTAPRPASTGSRDAGDAQRRGGAEIDLAVFDQDDAARRLTIDTVAPQDLDRLRRLRGAEPQIACAIARRDEPHGPLAEGARAVEQHDAAGGCRAHDSTLAPHGGTA